jgi:exosortase
MTYLIWTLTIVLYAPIFIALYRTRWDTVDYTHAYFILPLSLWLVWRKRLRIREIIDTNNQYYNNTLNFFLLLIGIVMHIFGLRQGYVFFQIISIIPFLYGLTGYLYGSQMAKELSFPILYLLLLVPPPFAILDSITLPMRHGISVATELILRIFDYPVTRSGLELTIGYNTIFMGAPCSGFRSLITMFSLVIVYVYILNGSLWKKLTLAACIIPMSLLGNLIRVITLCLITFYFGEEVGQGFFHNFSGIMIFIITLFGLIGIESLLNKFN